MILFLSCIFIFLAVLGLRCNTWAFSSCGLQSTDSGACRLSNRGAQAWLCCSTWDPSSLIEAQTCIPCTGRQILNHCATREAPVSCISLIIFLSQYFSIFVCVAIIIRILVCCFCVLLISLLLSHLTILHFLTRQWYHWQIVTIEFSLKFLKNVFICLFLAVLSLHCCSRASSYWSKWGLLFVAVLMACGIFPDQGSNWCPLHWQVDS